MMNDDNYTGKYKNGIAVTEDNFSPIASGESRGHHFAIILLYLSQPSVHSATPDREARTEDPQSGQGFESKDEGFV